jgi:hypothetical protein
MSKITASKVLGVIVRTYHRSSSRLVGDHGRHSLAT